MWHAWGRGEVFTGFWLGGPKVRDHCEDLSVGGRITLRWAFRRQGKNRDSSVGRALGYRLDDRGSRVQLPAGAGNFSLHHRVQNGSGVHPASFPMGTRGSFPGVKRAGREADHSPRLVPRS
jgi:hypothetical protein